MPKMKTHSGTKRRIAMTGSGKFVRAKGNKRHLKYGKSKRALAADEKTFIVSPTHRKKLQKLLPYGV